MRPIEVAIIGAGPYGLTAAAHLQAAGIEARVFGEVMGFWERHMPIGMVLRSERDGSHFADPQRRLTLDAYERVIQRQLPARIPLADYIAYGRWFQREAVPEIDPRYLRRIEPNGDGFRLLLDDGEAVPARRVVIATGLAAFAVRPAVFADVPCAIASHTSEQRDLSRFAGKRVAVIGSGQSALESAALLREAGADVEVLVRRPVMYWLGQPGHLSRESSRLGRLLYPPGAVGPLGINWIVQLPGLYRVLPEGWQTRVSERALRPAGSGWLRPRLADVTITLGRSVRAAAPDGERLRLELSDGSTRFVDHALLATGYRVELERYPFLEPSLARAITHRGGMPVLGPGFESSLRGLHFLGAASAVSFGPLMRFVAGTGYAARALARRVRGENAAVGRWPMVSEGAAD